MNKLDETWLLGSLRKLAADRLSGRGQADRDATEQKTQEQINSSPLWQSQPRKRRNVDRWTDPSQADKDAIEQKLWGSGGQKAVADDSNRRLAPLDPEPLRRQNGSYVPSSKELHQQRLAKTEYNRKAGIPDTNFLGNTPRGPGGIEQLTPINETPSTPSAREQAYIDRIKDVRIRKQNDDIARDAERASNTVESLRNERDAKFNMKWGAPGHQVFDERGGNLSTALPNTVDQSTGVRMGDRAGEQARGNLVSMGNEAVDIAGLAVGAGMLGTAAKGFATGGSILAHGAKSVAPNPHMRPSWGQQVMEKVRGAVGDAGERVMELSPAIRAGASAVGKAVSSPIGKAAVHVGEHKLQHDVLHSGQNAATQLARASNGGAVSPWSSVFPPVNPAASVATASAPPTPMPASAQNTNVRPTPMPASAQNTNVPAPVTPVQTAMPVPKAMPSPVAPMSAQNTGMKPSSPPAVPKSSPAMPKPTASAAPVSPVVKTSAFVAYGNERFASSFGGITDIYLRSRIPVVFT